MIFSSAAKIDKRKLLEIARKNAVNMMKEGVITGDKRKLISWKAGGSTVNELTGNLSVIVCFLILT